MIRMEIIYRHAKLNPWFQRFMSGWYTKLGVFLGSVGHRVKIHKIMSTTGKLRTGWYWGGDRPDRLSPPRTLILDFTMSHTRFWSVLHPIGQLTHTRCSDGVLESDGVLQTVVRDKIQNYLQIYLSRPDPIVFLSVTVDTRNRINFDSFTAMCAVVVSKTSCKDRNHPILRGVIAPYQEFFFLQ
jgi:hypothetical protein